MDCGFLYTQADRQTYTLIAIAPLPEQSKTLHAVIPLE